MKVPNPLAAGGETKTCPTCNGKRFLDRVSCSHCRGAGKVKVISRGNVAGWAWEVKCVQCRGRGYGLPICLICEGKGYSVGPNGVTHCEACHGTGHELRPCATCDGAGRVMADARAP
jgi:DnaJ-class molecular chaperone